MHGGLRPYLKHLAVRLPPHRGQGRRRVRRHRGGLRRVCVAAGGRRGRRRCSGVEWDHKMGKFSLAANRARYESAAPARPGRMRARPADGPPDRERAVRPILLPASVDSSLSTNTAGGGGTRVPNVAARPSWGVNERPPHRSAPRSAWPDWSALCCVVFPPPTEPDRLAHQSHSRRPEGGHALTLGRACARSLAPPRRGRHGCLAPHQAFTARCRRDTSEATRPASLGSPPTLLGAAASPAG